MCSSQVICPCFTTWELLSASCVSAFTPPSSQPWPGCASCLDTRGSSTRYASSPLYFKSSSPSAVSFTRFNSARRLQSGSCKHTQRRFGFWSVALVLHLHRQTPFWLCRLTTFTTSYQLCLSGCSASTWGCLSSASLWSSASSPPSCWRTSLADRKMKSPWCSPRPERRPPCSPETWIRQKTCF